MANLRNFLWSGSHDGMPVDIYLNRTPKIGNGTLVTVQPLNVALQGQATVFGQHVSGSVEIIMPDESSSGTCTVVLNGNKNANCPYNVDGNYLKIQVSGREITLGGAGDKQWTWLGVSGVPAWIGIWPGAQAMADDEAGREMAALPG